MAVAVVHKAGGIITTDTTSYSVAPGFTPATGKGWLLVLGHYTLSGGSTAELSTFGGIGMTWQRVASQLCPESGVSNLMRIELFAAVAGTPSTANITATHASSQGALAWDIFEVSGADLASIAAFIQQFKTRGLTAVGTTCDITFDATFQAGSAGFACWAGYGNSGLRTSTPRSGWTELRDHSDGDYGSQHVIWRADADPSSIAGITLSGSDYLGGIAVEINDAVTGYTLTAAHGTFTHSGQAATPKSGRLLTAAAATFALAGQAASLGNGHRVTADAGVLAVAGQATTLRAARTLPAAHASLSLAGQAANLVANAPELGAHTIDHDIQGTGGTSITTPAITTQDPTTLAVFVARGVLSNNPTPTDSKSNTFTQVGTAHAYTDWPSSGTATYVCLDAEGGASHTVSVGKTNNDEITVAVVEIRNVNRLVDWAWNEDLTDPTTSGSVDTVGPSLLVAVWWGDGDTGIGDHDATPNNGFTLIDAVVTGGIALIQCAVAVKQVGAGTHSVTWDADNAQGAQLWLLAFDLDQAAAITAGQGTFALSGQAAGVSAARQLAAAGGTLALAGQAATLSPGRGIAAGHSTVALAGQEASLSAARRLAADAGVASMTGQVAALAVAMPAGSATFSLAGQEATLRVSRRLSAEASMAALDGQAVALTAARVVVASGGAVAWSGQDASLTPTSGLSASHGSFGVSGQPATLLAARRLVAAHGQFSLTGQPALIFVPGLSLPRLAIGATRALNAYASGTAATNALAAETAEVEA